MYSGGLIVFCKEPKKESWSLPRRHMHGLTVLRPRKSLTMSAAAQ